MSLWTPYYDMEQALDLSVKPRFTMRSPSPVFSPPSTAISPQSFGSSFYRYHPYQQCHPCQSPSPPHRVPGEYVLPRTSPSLSPSSVGEPVKQAPRPFKAVTSALPECRSVLDNDPTYAAFREAMLAAMRARNGGTLTVSNPRMRRSVRRSSQTEEDMDYLERRARNNAAAKRSRDIRRQKEDELAIKAAFLQRKISELQAQLAARAADCLCCRVPSC